MSDTAANVADQEESIAGSSPVDPDGVRRLAASLRGPIVQKEPSIAAAFEQVFWPVKITDADIPSYIVPIRSWFALHLFDDGLGQQDLFGRRVDLALQTELVYYRAAEAIHPQAPARILWYVSQAGNTPGTMQIRACSRLDDMEIGLPNDLYRKNKQLGVYSYDDVLGVVKGDRTRKMMAMRFSGTELFKNPILWTEMQDTVKAAGINSNLQCPVKVPPEVFFKLYAAGVR